MKYNFKTGRVTFKADDHSYTNDKGQSYTSVTTLLKEYSKPFDSDYWSQYKAIKDVMENFGLRVWTEYKDRAGGWEGVVDYYRRGKTLPPEVNRRVIDRKTWYLEQWQSEADLACKLGSEQHDGLEQLFLTSKKIDLGNKKIAEVSSADLLDLQGFSHGESSVYPELLLWNDRYRLAGQADLVERQKLDVHIKDYKTCKEIKMEPFMGQMMLGPLAQLPDTNYSKFTMQLSSYGWMLEQIGYNVVGLTMIHIHRESGEHIQDYPLAYRKDLVEAMLEDYDSK